MKKINCQICTGCSACYSICPVQCISMEQDKEGFLYPVIDKDKCIECKKCESVCRRIIQGKERKPLHIYAAKNQDEEIRYQSSSGGIFTLLAEYVIQKGGIVFGAKFNEQWEVVHDYTDTIDGLAAFRGSKYVQSRIGDTFKIANDFLAAGRYILFSGTPCQIAGLKSFLNREYERLLTVDIVCHGVPSPLVWKKYLNEIRVLYNTKVKNIQFRDKIYGWKQSQFRLETRVSEINGKTNIFLEPIYNNIFFKAFELNMRLSCYDCQTRHLKSGSDITIGDYWGIQDILPEFDDDKGVSLVLCNTEKGQLVYGQINKIDQETRYFEAVKGNPNIEKNVLFTSKRTKIFKNIHTEPIIPVINRLTNVFFLKRIIIALLRRLGLLSLIKSVLQK